MAAADDAPMCMVALTLAPLLAVLKHQRRTVPGTEVASTQWQLAEKQVVPLTTCALYRFLALCDSDTRDLLLCKRIRGGTTVLYGPRHALHRALAVYQLVLAYDSIARGPNCPDAPYYGMMAHWIEDAEVCVQFAQQAKKTSAVVYTGDAKPIKQAIAQTSTVWGCPWWSGLTPAGVFSRPWCQIEGGNTGLPTASQRIPAQIKAYHSLVSVPLEQAVQDALCHAASTIDETHPALLSAWERKHKDAFNACLAAQDAEDVAVESADPADAAADESAVESADTAADAASVASPPLLPDHAARDQPSSPQIASPQVNASVPTRINTEASDAVAPRATEPSASPSPVETSPAASLASATSLVESPAPHAATAAPPSPCGTDGSASPVAATPATTVDLPAPALVLPSTPSSPPTRGTKRPASDREAPPPAKRAAPAAAAGTMPAEILELVLEAQWSALAHPDMEQYRAASLPSWASPGQTYTAPVLLFPAATLVMLAYGHFIRPHTQGASPHDILRELLVQTAPLTLLCPASVLQRPETQYVFIAKDDLPQWTRTVDTLARTLRVPLHLQHVPCTDVPAHADLLTSMTRCGDSETPCTDAYVAWDMLASYTELCAANADENAALTEAVKRVLQAVQR